VPTVDHDERDIVVCHANGYLEPVPQVSFLARGMCAEEAGTAADAVWSTTTPANSWIARQPSMGSADSVSVYLSIYRCGPPQPRGRGMSPGR
jgi:hypothetical protein